MMHCLPSFWGSQWLGTGTKMSYYKTYWLMNSNFSDKLRKLLISFIQLHSLFSLLQINAPLLQYSMKLI